MVYQVDESLANFKFWSGAKDNADLLTYDELQQLDDILPDYFGASDELPTDTEINDMFWMDFETVCHALGYAYIDGEIVRSEDDIPESLAKEKLEEYYDDLGYTYTEEQLDAVYKRCVDEGDVFTLDADSDSIELEDYHLEDYGKEAGMSDGEDEDEE